MIDLEYLRDRDGNLKAVVIPIDIWKSILPNDESDENSIAEAIEDYCLGRAIDEGKQTPSLTQEEARNYLGLS